MFDLGPRSNGEYLPYPPSPAVREAARRLLVHADHAAPRLGLSRRQFLQTLCGAATALVVPRGVAIAGSAMILLGTAMVLVGYAAGAYGAFSEDSLYGFLYLVIPLYTAYYLVTRWDDLRGWFALSTAGVGLVLLGTEVIRWSGA